MEISGLRNGQEFMESSSLSEREAQILQALVEIYVEIGMPVGSQTLCRRENWDISPATVRNALATLEKKGFVEQPHTSAGRIPTDKGYRFYVARRMSEGGFSQEQEEVRLRKQLQVHLPEGSYQEILGQLAKVLGEVSNQLGLVMAPHFEQGIFHHLELVQLAEKRLLLVVSIRQGLVKSLVLEVDSGISREELEVVSRLFNERLAGLSMAEIRRSMRQRLSMLKTGNPQLLRAVTEEIEGMVVPSGAELYVAGTHHICRQPEFRDSFRVAELMELVEHKDLLARLLGRRRGVVITIGKENTSQAMQLCSVVTASYEVNGALGLIGVIGPTRMAYGRVVNLVSCAAFQAASLAS